MAEVQVETKEELTTSSGKAGLAQIWTQEIENSSCKENDWRKEATKFFQIYKDELEVNTDSGKEGARYNVFWANTQTLRPLVFSNLPNPNVTRRFLDKDESARILSEMMERSMSFFLEETDASSIFSKSRDDYLVGGRGLARVVFDPAEVLQVEKEKENEEDEQEFEEDLDLDTKKVRLEYVDWQDIRISPETVWEDVRWIAFRHKMNRAQLIEQFGSKGAKVNLDSSSLVKENDEFNTNEKDHELFKLAEVWEVWDKVAQKVLFVTTGSQGMILSDEDDTYNLKGFFPIARPLGSNANPCDLIPIPLYRYYKSQAEELNELDARIRSLNEQCKFTGVYSSISEDNDVQSLLDGSDGEFNPLTAVQPGADITKSIFIKPITEIANVTSVLNAQKAQVIQNIRDITGLSDIVRGTTLASETATAQRLKGDFAISRIQPLQKEVEIFVRNTMRLTGELIVENYTVEELAKITNLQIVDIDQITKETLAKQSALFDEAVQQINPQDPEAQQKIDQLNQQQEVGFKKTMQPFIDQLKGYAATPAQLAEIDAMMKDDKLRSFSVDIETDSTVRVDQQQHKADMTEYVQAVSAYVSQMTPAVQIGAINKEAFNQILAEFSRAFKVGRNLEEYLLAEPPEEEQDQGPSVEEQIQLAENQRADQRLQLDAQKQQTDADQNQQKINIDKAKVKVDIEQFNDNIEFQDVNKEADRRAKTSDQIIQEATQRASNAVRDSV